jgi:hypothetical protein
MNNEIIDKLITILNKNLPKEQRSKIWEWCISHISKVEINKMNLDNMANTELVWGIYGGYPGNEGNPTINRKAIENLAKAIGTMGVQNPEGGVNLWPIVNNEALTDSELLRKIENEIGFKINLPDFIGGGDITKTDYGIITDRHCHYLWILKRILDLYPYRCDRKISIIEIGAGMGFLGYFLDKIGYYDYTIIDLAYSNMIQSYFLHKNLPERKMILSGDVKNPFDAKYKNALKILHASDFKDIPSGRFDIMINIDGLTEMNLNQAHEYVNNDYARLLLSINHEMNSCRVIDICKATKILKYRYPFWLRDGYVEELYQSIFLDPYEKGLFTLIYKS